MAAMIRQPDQRALQEVDAGQHVSEPRLRIHIIQFAGDLKSLMSNQRLIVGGSEALALATASSAALLAASGARQRAPS
jgi:hypothetical protein